MRKQAAEWSEHLAEVHSSKWPPRRPDQSEYPEALWRSRRFLVQVYAAEPFAGIEVRRLSVNRVTIGNGGDWDAGIRWEDLQRIKRETGHGDWYAVEIYPRDRDLVNVANLRHLWVLREPLPIGWFQQKAKP